MDYRDDVLTVLQVQLPSPYRATTTCGIVACKNAAVDVIRADDDPDWYYVPPTPIRFASYPGVVSEVADDGTDADPAREEVVSISVRRVDRPGLFPRDNRLTNWHQAGSGGGGDEESHDIKRTVRSWKSDVTS